MEADLRFTRSLVIKDSGYDNEIYYDHLAGIPTGVSTDIKITTLEDGIERIYSRELLENYRLTYEELLKWGDYYTDLIEKYPEYRVYIKGCMLPTAKAVSINAEEHTILNYDRQYVSPNEVDLIPKINDFIKRYLDKYLYNSIHAANERHYILTILSTVLLAIPNLLKLLRIENIGTSKMSVPILLDKYLIDNFIDSHVVNILTIGQKFWLYANMRSLGNALSNEKSEELLTVLWDPKDVYRVHMGSRLNGNLSTPYIRNLATKELGKPISISKILTSVDNTITDKKIGTNNITSLYYIDSKYPIADILAPDLAFNLWGHYVLTGRYDNVISFNYPFDKDSATPYTLDTKTAYIYVRGLQHLFYDNNNFPTMFEVPDSLMVKQPTVLKSDTSVLDNKPVNLSEFISLLNSVKEVFANIYTEAIKAPSEDSTKYMLAFAMFTSIAKYPAPPEDIKTWITENTLPIPAKEDIGRLCDLIKQQVIGHPEDVLSQSTKNQLLKTLFSKFNSYTTSLLLEDRSTTIILPSVNITLTH